MKRLLLHTLAILLLSLVGARGQFGSFGDVPIEIDSEDTRLENGIAIRVVQVNYESIGVDVPDDVERVENALRTLESKQSAKRLKQK